MSFVCANVYFEPCEACHFQAAASATKALCIETFPSPRVILHLEKKNGEGEKKNCIQKGMHFSLETVKLFPQFWQNLGT